MSEELSGQIESRSLNGDDPLFKSVLPHQDRPKDRIWVQVVLLLATIYTTTMAGTLMSPDLVGGDVEGEDWTLLFNLRFLSYGLPFSMTLLAILGIHEMGHYVTSRWWHVRASLPYFIPFPSIIGTMGAVIRVKSRIPNRRALIDIGASGPLAGFVMAVVALGVGLHRSDVIAVQDVPVGALSLGDSILSAYMGQLIIGHLPEGYDVMLHPMAFAGWLGLFVTVLNLLPMGQFDGGHIIYGIFGQHHARITKGTLVALGLFWVVGPPYDWLHAPDVYSTWLDSRWLGWLVWLFMGLIMGRRHPSPSDPNLVLDPTRKWIGYLSLVILVLCFIPHPINFTP